MRYPIRTSGPAPRRGIAMIAVLVVVSILALAAYRYTRSVKARGFADSGIHYAAAVLASQNTQTSTTTQASTNYYDNPSLFQGILVQDGDDARARGRFSIVSPMGSDAAAGGGI